MLIISERLKFLRGTQSKAEFARFLGVSAPLYQMYESGRTPKSDKLSLIANKCGVTIDWLMGHDDPPDARHAESDFRTKIHKCVMRMPREEVAKALGVQDLDELLIVRSITATEEKKLTDLMVKLKLLPPPKEDSSSLAATNAILSQIRDELSALRSEVHKLGKGRERHE